MQVKTQRTSLKVSQPDDARCNPRACSPLSALQLQRGLLMLICVEVDAEMHSHLRTHVWFEDVHINI